METEEVKVSAATLGPPPVFTPVSAPIDSAPTSSRRRSQRRPWPRKLVMAAYGLASLIVAAVVVGSILSHDALQQTDASIVEMQAQLHQTTVQIAHARARLTQAEQETGAATGALAASSDQLGKVQAQLASAESNIHVDGVSIANLDACLAGVNQALNEISLGDQGGASATLNQYAGDCQAAEPSG